MSTITSPIKNWSHPFKPRSGDLDPLRSLTAMSKAGSGFYPIGKNGQWHGGIHFDANTASVFDQSSVRCIADGEVIAYRIDSSYPLSGYLDERERPRNAPFSTGFVLVKHRLEAPALPASEEPPPTLTFYSLYMHLLDWSGYSKPEAPTPPEFISETLYQVKPDKATDTLVGLRVRSQPGGTVLAILPKGCKVRVGEAHSVKPQWRKLISILQGRSLPAISGPDLGWVYTGEMQPTSEEDQFLVGELANDPEPSLAPEKGLNVRKAGRHGTPKTGLIPQGATFSLEPGTGTYRKLKAIIVGQDVAPLSTNSVQNIQGYVHFESLQSTRAVPELDKVHILDVPYPIKAGDLIGHLGLYQNHDDASPQNMLHLEVFSCEDVPRFIAKSRAWAARLPVEQKSLLKVYKGASKLVHHHSGISSSNPPQLSDTGTMVGIDLLIPQTLLDKLPADRKLKVSTPLPGSSTPRVTNWWRLDNLLADASGNPISGWLAEQEGITTRHNPWEWVGYDFIEETGRPIGKAAYLFDVLRRLTDKERANYRALVSQEDQGPVRARLYDIIDSNRDGKLTSDEVRSAMERPWHAQSIVQIITRHESEWLLNKEKWDELDPLMEHIPRLDPNQNWVSEKERIDKLSWWGDLAGKQGITADGVAWHFHPVSLLACLAKKSSDLITLEMLKKAKPSVADEYYTSILPYLNKYAKVYRIDNPLLLAHFLSQVGHESGFKVRSEDLNYSARRMRQVFGCRNNISGYDSSTDECIVLPRRRPKLWSEESKYANNAENLGNYVYASINGNGNESSGDGYKYRGRGIIQLTGRANYESYNQIHNEKNPSDPKNFIENPDLIIDNLDYGVESAFVWWDMNRLNRRIQESYDLRTEADIPSHVADISNIVNGGTIGLSERVELFNNLRLIIKEEHGL